MAKNVPQTYENHARFVPMYHFVGFGIIVVYLLWALWNTVFHFSLGAFFGFAVAVALLILFLYARLFALTAQDRIIRLEERLRLERLLPADLRPRIVELATGQLVALRFASDDELPALARRVLDEKIEGRDAIKRLIKTWRADDLRV